MGRYIFFSARWGGAGTRFRVSGVSQVLFSSSGGLPNTTFLFGPLGFWVLGSGSWVLGFGFRGVPDFPEIPGRSRSSVFSTTLVHEIVDFRPNLDRGPFGGHFSAKT